MADWLTAATPAIDAEWLRALGAEAWVGFRAWASDGFERVPLLMIALALMATLPLLALAGLISNLVAQRRPPPRPEAPMTHERATPRHAWLRVEGEHDARCLLSRELHSIGRDDDNDVQLSDGSVHRHHAVVQVTDDQQFIVRDLSGAGGNGVKVNGARVMLQQALEPGDVIEVGRVHLRFEARAF